MEYSISQLAELAGVSTRTLRWYDRIGLLKPLRIGENGYRYYGEAEVDRLQQVLFYRELGVELDRIRALLDDPGFDRMAALKSHLAALEKDRRRVEALIGAVRRTIDAEERNEPMKNAEKFEAFKREAVARNESEHGTEARLRYGDGAVDASHDKIRGMSREQYDEWKRLEQEILDRLESAVRRGISVDSDEAAEIVRLHKRWLCFTLPTYTPEIHLGIVQMYTADPRFQSYYDRNLPNCAAFLADSVRLQLLPR